MKRKQIFFYCLLLTWCFMLEMGDSKAEVMRDRQPGMFRQYGYTIFNSSDTGEHRLGSGLTVNGMTVHESTGWILRPNHSWSANHSRTVVIDIPNTVPPFGNNVGVTRLTLQLDSSVQQGSWSSGAGRYNSLVTTDWYLMTVVYPDDTAVDHERRYVGRSGQMWYASVINSQLWSGYGGAQLPAQAPWSADVYMVTGERFYYPIINDRVPNPASEETQFGIGRVDGILSNVSVELSDTLHLWDASGVRNVKSGGTHTLLTQVGDGWPFPPNGYFLHEWIAGAPMNDGTFVTGIGNSTWIQKVTDFDGDSTEFASNVKITTSLKPMISLVYATGALENTTFSDGTANGGVDGWSNVPLKATVLTRNTDNTYIVNGYYFNRLNDELGGSTHGSAHKENASAVYNASTTNAGIWLTGVMVDDAKTTELSATTEPVTIKIDMENPVAAVSYDTVTDTLVNDSSDTLSGLQTTTVAIVQAGAPVPAESDYVEFANWETLINGNGEYDVYVIAIDNAGNQATTTLHNQLFTGSATSLEISKTVVGKYGEYNKPFEITVTLKDDANNLVNGSYEVTSSMADIGNYSVTFTAGKAVLHIRHGEMIAINGLPLGYTYTVQNTDKSITEGHSPYIVTYNGSASATGITNTLDSNVAQVMIASTRETIPDMGIFEENHNFAIGSALLLLSALITTITICERKRNLK